MLYDMHIISKVYYTKQGGCIDPMVPLGVHPSLQEALAVQEAAAADFGEAGGRRSLWAF